MTKQRNIQFFDFEANGTVYNFRAWTTSTRAGFCHHVESRGQMTRVSYYNRSWESYEYESTLLQWARRYAGRDAEPLRQAIEAHGCRLSADAEKTAAAFAANFAKLSERAKAQTREAVDRAGGVENVGVETLGAVVALGALLGA